jgi:Tol biopolymer transport system component
MLLAMAMLVAACTGQSAGGPSARPSSPSPATRGPSSSGPPAATDLHGLIAYSAQGGDIWVMNADGSNRRRVTHAGGHDFDPSLSPDGKRIVFRTSRGHYQRDPTGTGLEGIFVVDVDGSNEHEIQPPNGGLFPDWSPDGKRIALSTLRADQTETIVTMDPDGTHVHDTGVSGGECSEWSPDGTKIAYCHHPSAGLFDVWVMNTDGSHRRQLTDAIGNDYPGAWSPDGKRIAFGSQREGSFDVFVMNADGSHQTRLSTGPDHESPEAWLPDGRIVYSSFHGDEPLPTWYVMDADGTNVRSLPQLAGAGDPIDWLSPPALHGRLAFASDREDNVDVYVLDLPGGRLHRLTRSPGVDMSPTWSPDGTHIAFRSDRAGNDEVFVMNIDGTNQRNLTRNPASDYSPAWSPDGKRIAFATARDDPTGNDVWLMNTDGSHPRPLVEQGGIDEYPVWSPDGSRVAFGCTLGKILASRVGDFEICVVNADGTGLNRITDALGISAAGGWSPDGKRIVFASNRDQDPGGVTPCGDIYVMNADGSHVVKITDGPPSDCDASWTPDGRHIVFSSDRADPGGNSDLYVMNADGSDITRLTTLDANEQEPQILPSS